MLRPQWNSLGPEQHRSLNTPHRMSLNERTSSRAHRLTFRAWHFPRSLARTGFGLAMLGSNQSPVQRNRDSYEPAFSSRPADPGVLQKTADGDGKKAGEQCSSHLPHPSQRPQTTHPPPPPALQTAAQNGDSDVAHVMAGPGGDLQQGSTLFWLAVENGHVDTVRYALECRLEVDQPTPLPEASTLLCNKNHPPDNSTLLTPPWQSARKLVNIWS